MLHQFCACVATSQLDRLCAELLTSEQRELEFVQQLGSLENLLVDRTSLFQGSAEDTVQTLLREQRAFVNATPGDDKSVTVADASHLADKPLHKATMAAGFRACELSIKTLDLTTAAGRQTALEYGFSSGSVLIIRLLLYGEKNLAKRHPLLTALLECRIDLAQYYGYCLTVDKTTGIRPKRVRNWGIAGKTDTATTILGAWTKQQIVGTDFYHNEGGVYPLKTALDGTLFDPIHQEDFWCRPACIKSFCEYMHTLTLADGFPATVASGFTWITAGEQYIAHLLKATRLNNRDEQLEWLSDASDQWISFLRYVQQRKRMLIQSPLLEENTFGAIAPDDVPAFVAMRDRQQAQETFIDQRDTWKWLGSAQPSVIDPEKLPLLSELKKGKPSTEKKPKADPKLPKTPRAPREEKGDEPPTKAISLAPGSKADAHVWLEKGKTLLVSGLVWNVQGLAKDKKTTVDAKCWPTILNRRKGGNKLANCPTFGKPGCTSLSDARHVLAGFKFDVDQVKFARDPTTAETKKIPTDPLSSAKPSFRRPSTS